MAVNKATDALPDAFLAPATVPSKTELVFLLNEIQQAITTLTEMVPQVADNPPARPRRGWIRLAVAPWDPLGTAAAQQLVRYDGTNWIAV